MSDDNFVPSSSSENDEYESSKWGLRPSRRRRMSLSPPATPTKVTRHSTYTVPTITPTLQINTSCKPATHGKLPKRPYFKQKKRSTNQGFQKANRNAGDLDYPLDQVTRPVTETVASKKLNFVPKIDAKSNETNSNIILNTKVFQQIFTELTVCCHCLQGTVIVTQSGMKSGSASYIELTCDSCENSRCYWSVGGKFQGKLQVGNRQISKRNELIFGTILAGRLIGIGHNKIGLYHSILDIPSPPTSGLFSTAQTEIIIASEYIARQSITESVRELRTLHSIPADQEYLHTIVSYDGAYQQRPGKSGGGFSRYCFAAAISVDTGKVLSYDIACNSCKQCTEYENKVRSHAISEEDYTAWKLKHIPLCPAKYSQFASVQLESALAPVIVRSALEYGVVFTGMVTDGDNKTHETLKKERIYEKLGFGEIERIECLAHAAKRMKINILKFQEKAIQSSRTDKKIQKQISAGMNTVEIQEEIDPISLETISKDFPSQPIHIISEAIAGQIASYYKLAIKRYAGDIPAIILAINAIPMHMSANDGNADEKHSLCPKDDNTWCRYQYTRTHQLPTSSHPAYLSDEAVAVVNKVFTHFGYNTPAFVSKVQDGRTSNHNESLHSILWSMVLKNEYSSYEMMQLGSALAVIRYNDGYSGIRRVLDVLKVPVSSQTSLQLQHLDNCRIIDSQRILTKQKNRFVRKQLRSKKALTQIQKFGIGYSSGRFSAATKSDSSTSGVETESILQSHEQSVACLICNRLEDSSIDGMDVGASIESEIHWIQCDSCNSWFHMQCSGIVNSNEVTDKDGWNCTNCSML